MTKSCETDNLVVAYYGQDCDIFDPGCHFDNLPDEYIATSSPFHLRILLANIHKFEQEPLGLKVFTVRYSADFAPDRWNMTAAEWLSAVKVRVIKYLHANGYSSE